jgi:hypothetical protein
MERMGLTMSVQTGNAGLSITLRDLDISLHARQEASGQVACRLRCNGQNATVTFTGTDVVLDVPETPAAGS